MAPETQVSMLEGQQLRSEGLHVELSIRYQILLSFYPLGFLSFSVQ